MSNKKPIRQQTVYPSTLERFGAPPNVLANILKNYGEDILERPNRTMEGIEVHDAFDRAFKHLTFERSKFKKGTTPGAAQIKGAIDRSFIKSQQALHMKTSRKSASFVKNVLADYGPEVLKNPNLKVMSEHDLVGTDGKYGSRSTLGGRLDLLFFDEATKEARIFDYKTHGDTEFTMSMDREILKKSWQSKGYIVGVNDELAPSKISMTYLFNNQAYGEGKGYHAVTLDGLDPTSLGRAGGASDDIQKAIAQIEAYKQTASDKVRMGGAPALEKYIMELTQVGDICSSAPAACRTCPLRYTCKQSAIIKQEIEKGYKGEKFVKSEIKSVEQMTRESEYDKRFASESHVEITESKFKDDIRSHRERRIPQLMNEGPVAERLGIMPATMKVNKEIAALRSSQSKRRTLMKSAFQTEVMKGAISAETMLPFSILKDSTKASWMNTKLNKAFNETANTLISDVVDGVESKAPLVAIQEEVKDKVFKNEKFVNKLTKKIYQKAGRELKGQNLQWDNPQNIKYTLSKMDKIIDKDIVNMIQTEIHEETVKQIIHVDYDAIVSKGGKELVKEKNIKAITKGLVDKDIIKTNPKGYLDILRKAGRRISKLDGSKLSIPKFPLPMVAAAGILAYISGIIGVHNTLSNKADKAYELVTRDREIDAGQHSSLMTVARRLMSSDFGSSYMKWKGYSSTISAIKTWGEDAFNIAKDTISRSTAKSKLDDGFEFIGDSIGKIRNTPTANSRDNIKDIIENNPSTLFLGGIGAGFIAMGLLPNIRTDREIGQDTEDRKKRFKRLKQVNWNKASEMYEQESDLRSAYKTHTPFGSPMVPNLGILKDIANSKMFRDWDIRDPSNIFKLVKTWFDGPNLINGAESARTSVTKSLATKVRTAGNVVSDMLGNVRNIVKRTTGKAHGIVAEAENYAIDKSKGHSRLIAQKEGIRGTQDFVDTNLRKNVKNQDIANYIPGKNLRNKMPVVKEPKIIPKETIVQTFNKNDKKYRKVGMSKVINNKELTVIDGNYKPRHLEYVEVPKYSKGIHQQYNVRYDGMTPYNTTGIVHPTKIDSTKIKGLTSPIAKAPMIENQNFHNRPIEFEEGWRRNKKIFGLEYKRTTYGGSSLF